MTAIESRYIVRSRATPNSIDAPVPRAAPVHPVHPASDKRARAPIQKSLSDPPLAPRAPKAEVASTS